MDNASAISDIKAIAKVVSSSLKREGHNVPHNAVLNALAAALDMRDWHVLKATVNGRPQSENVESWLKPIDSTPNIIELSVFNSDKQIITIVDVTKYFLKIASISDLKDFNKSGFHTDTLKRITSFIESKLGSLTFDPTISTYRVSISTVQNLLWAKRKADVALAVCDLYEVEIFPTTDESQITTYGWKCPDLHIKPASSKTGFISPELAREDAVTSCLLLLQADFETPKFKKLFSDSKLSSFPITA